MNQITIDFLTGLGFFSTTFLGSFNWVSDFLSESTIVLFVKCVNRHGVRWNILLYHTKPPVAVKIDWNEH